MTMMMMGMMMMMKMIIMIIKVMMLLDCQVSLRHSEQQSELMQKFLNYTFVQIKKIYILTVSS